MKYLLILLFSLPVCLNAEAKENPLEIFRSMVGFKWLAEGEWGDGSKFFQEIDLEFGLNDSIIIVQSRGYIDPERKILGNRNHGIRQFDRTSGQIRFWEFDVFGGVTEGTVSAVGKNLVYVYDYGGIRVTDMWIYVDEETYEFVVGVFENNQWKQKFLETTFKRKNR